MRALAHAPPSGNRTQASLDLSFQSSTLDSRVSLTRSTNIGTYFDASGTLNKAAFNICLQSASLTTTPWSLNHAGVVLPVLTAASTSAPDGTLTGTQIVMPAVSVATNLSCVIQSFTGTAAPYSFSIYLKGQSGGEQVWLTLQTGGGVDTVTLATLTTSWQRFSVVNATMTAATCFIEIGTDLRAGSGQSATPAQTFYAWGGQLEQSSTVGSYAPTTTVANGAARLDYGPGGGTTPLGLLVEESRVNSIRNSVCAGAVVGTPGTAPTNWTASSVGLTYGVLATGTEYGMPYVDYSVSGTSSGSNTTFALQFETGTGVAASSGQVWSASCYGRFISGSVGIIPGLFITENTAAGAFLTNSSANVNLTTSLQRFTVTRTLNNASTGCATSSLFFFWGTAGIVISFTLRVYQPQFELGAFATSPIITSGAIATRAAEVASMPLGSWFSTGDFSIATNIYLPYAPVGTSIFLEVDNGASVRTIMYSSGGTNVSINNSSGLNLTIGTSAAGIPFRAAASFSANGSSGVLNGGTVASTAGVAQPTGQTTLLFMQPQSGNQRANGYVQRVRFWPRALTSAQLQAASDWGYSGPGDSVTSATAWYGLRGYNKAVSATGTQKAINIRRASDNATLDIVILPNGNLDVNTAIAFLNATTGFVATWYDQSGNANHAVQATTTRQPQLVFSVIGSLPVVRFVGSNLQKLALTITSVAQPWTISAVCDTTHSTANDYVLAAGNTFAPRLQLQNTSSLGAAIYAGGTVVRSNQVNTIGTFYALTGVANGASSIISTNSVEVTGSAGTTAFGTPLTIGSDGTDESPLTGDMGEVGLWPSGFSSPQRSAITNNQRSYWGI